MGRAGALCGPRWQGDGLGSHPGAQGVGAEVVAREVGQGSGMAARDRRRRNWSSQKASPPGPHRPAGSGRPRQGAGCRGRGGRGAGKSGQVRSRGRDGGQRGQVIELGGIAGGDGGAGGKGHQAVAAHKLSCCGLADQHVSAKGVKGVGVAGAVVAAAQGTKPQVTQGKGRRPDRCRWRQGGRCSGLWSAVASTLLVGLGGAAMVA